MLLMVLMLLRRTGKGLLIVFLFWYISTYYKIDSILLIALVELVMQ